MGEGMGEGGDGGGTGAEDLHLWWESLFRRGTGSLSGPMTLVCFSSFSYPHIHRSDLVAQPRVGAARKHTSVMGPDQDPASRRRRRKLARSRRMVADERLPRRNCAAAGLPARDRLDSGRRESAHPHLRTCNDRLLHRGPWQGA
jgi:hypothetical protein